MAPWCESSPIPHRDELSRLLFGTIENRGIKPNKFWLACSGGLDSMVLMDLFASWAHNRFPLEILHVNYGLRGAESEGDADFVGQQAKLRGLPCQILKAHRTKGPNSGIQDWARQIRYEWFAKLCCADDILLLAHHEDDHVETILMRIMRGSGLSGLQGMRDLQGIYWRPLLALSRDSIREIAKREKILHREDSSNAKLDYSRNRIRKLILPELEEMFPGAGRNLKDLAQAGQEWTNFYGKLFADLNPPSTPRAWQDMGFHPASQWILSKMRSLSWPNVSKRPWLEALYRGLIEGAELVMQLDPEHQVRLNKGQLEFELILQSPSPRWQQYSKELSKEGLLALLSPGSQIDTTLDGGLEMQDNKDRNRQSVHPTKRSL